MKYTEAVHAKRLLMMLEKPNPCEHCPDGSNRYILGDGICEICAEFVGYSQMTDSYRRCPCHELGKSEAIKRTWLTLEEKGYI